MANDPAVRARLTADGLVIPADTVFLGGMLDTCSERITWYDVERLPAAHRADLAALKHDCDAARAHDALERCRRFDGVSLGITPAEALRAFVTYRVCDVGLLTAGVVLHHAVGSGDFDRVFSGAWPTAVSLVPPETAATAALLLVLAALGKSAQVPVSGWLPRAMEGPTPSSAIFYGALSIHAGADLLLRCAPLLDAAPWVARLLVSRRPAHVPVHPGDSP
jgi:hypothetical protein